MSLKCVVFYVSYPHKLSNVMHKMQIGCHSIVLCIKSRLKALLNVSLAHSLVDILLPIVFRLHNIAKHVDASDSQTISGVKNTYVII